MKKVKHILAWTLCLVLLLPLAGCKKENKNKTVSISNYHGEITNETTGLMEYNKNLFYRNDHGYGGPDPFLLDNTQRDGYYYLYFTGAGNTFCSRSKDLVDWELLGGVLDIWETNSVERNVCYEQIWAPEVVYEDGTYYIFFSATPKADTSVKEGEGVLPGQTVYQMMVATSDKPEGPYKLVNFLDAESCGEENLHSFNQEIGLTDENGEFIQAYPHYYAGYLFFDPDDMFAFASEHEASLDVNEGGYQCAIDPHPYVDPVTGNKYLYWVANRGENAICVVQMESWLKPMWETATVVARTYYYTTEDYELAKTDPNAVERPPYDTNVVNEGPQVLYHNGKYYLTLSTGEYSDTTYQVVQAIGDSPVGPFRKLKMQEGGILLSATTQGSQEISGTGHHSFVTKGESQYIVYHRHIDFTVMGGNRDTAIDEIKWITVKDIYGQDMEVMYVNGPTSTIQPLYEGNSEYKNIAGKAKVSCDDTTVNTAWLTDGLLSLNKVGDPTMKGYIQETTITKTTTFQFAFDTPQKVCAIMAYESMYEMDTFKSIKSIEITYEKDGRSVVGVIENIPLSKDMYQEAVVGNQTELYYISPGAAIFAEFEELNVSKICITFELSEKQSQVGISEIKILGKET